MRAHQDAVQQRVAALAAARHFLASLACAGQPDLPASELRECLSRCREHLAAVVAASSPQAPLAQ